MLIFLVQLYKADKTAHFMTNIVDSLKSLTNGLTDIVLLEPLYLMFIIHGFSQPCDHQ